MSHDHTHDEQHVLAHLQQLQKIAELLQITNQIQKLALLKLLPNESDSVIVELDSTKIAERIVNDEADGTFVNAVQVRRRGDVIEIDLA